MITRTYTKGQLDQIRRGDKIVAIDGRPVTDKVVAYELALGRIQLKTPAGSKVEHNLYPDTQVERDVTIERKPKTGPLEPGERVWLKSQPEREGTVTAVYGGPANNRLIGVAWDFAYQKYGVAAQQMVNRRELRRIED